MSLVSLAKNPVPSGAVVALVESYDGTKLRVARWEATRAPLCGTVVLVPGRSEFIEKYFEVVADLRRRGFAVVVADLRGQGGSDRALRDPHKGHVWSFKEYDRDLDVVMREVVAQYCPRPYIGLGHSLGGHILLRAGSKAASPFERMVLSAPMIQINNAQLNGVSPGLARVMSEVATLFGGGRLYVPGGKPPDRTVDDFKGNPLTSDHERYMRARAVLAEAPDLDIGSPTIGWLRAAFRSMAHLQAPDTPGTMRVPMLFFVAGEDQIVSATAIEDFAVRTKLGTTVLLASSRHEILQETDEIRSRFWAAFDAYLTSAAAAA